MPSNEGIHQDLESCQRDPIWVQSMDWTPGTSYHFTRTEVHDDFDHEEEISQIHTVGNFTSWMSWVFYDIWCKWELGDIKWKNCKLKETLKTFQVKFLKRQDKTTLSRNSHLGKKTIKKRRKWLLSELG